MKKGGGGSAMSCIARMIEYWSGDRIALLALYVTKAGRVWYWWGCETTEEERWLKGNGGAVCVFRGSYWRFMDRVAVAIGRKLQEDSADGLPTDF